MILEHRKGILVWQVTSGYGNDVRSAQKLGDCRGRMLRLG